MKEYRLVAWAELPAPYHRTAYRRMLNDMSHRHMSVAQLAACSGVRRKDVQHFIDLLDGRGLLSERDSVRVGLRIRFTEAAGRLDPQGLEPLHQRPLSVSQPFPSAKPAPSGLCRFWRRCC